MGYIFDAINRNEDDQPPRREDGPSPIDAFSLHEPAESAEPEQPTDPTLDPMIELTYHTHQLQEEASGVEEVIESTSTDTQEKQPLGIATATGWMGLDVQQFDDRLVAVTEPSSLMAEEYRSIRTSLLARWQQKRKLIHTITSATPQEGKTITSMNLGLAFAELRNRRTIVVEADLRLPTFDKLLNIETKIGLLDYLRGNAEIDQIIQQIGEHPLHVISAGHSTQSEAVQLLSSSQFSQLLNQLRQRYDHVIIDTPPVVELADAGIVGALSDDVMLIVRMNRTPRSLVEQAIQTLQNYNAPVTGAIVTDHVRHRHKYYYYRYGYRYQYAASDQTAATPQRQAA